MYIFAITQVTPVRDWKNIRRNLLTFPGNVFIKLHDPVQQIDGEGENAARYRQLLVFILMSKEPQLQFAQLLKVQLPSTIQIPSFFHVTDSFWPHLLGAHVSNMFRYNLTLACFLSGFSFPLFTHWFYLYSDSLPFSTPTWFKHGIGMLNMCIQTKMN